MILDLESLERLVEIEEFRRTLLREHESLVQRQRPLPAPALLTQPGAGAIHQNPPHDFRGDAEKLSTILPVCLLLID